MRYQRQGPDEQEYPCFELRCYRISACAQLLINVKADISANALSNDNRDIHDHLECAQLLLDAKANINATTINNDTERHAVSNGHPTCVLSAKANTGIEAKILIGTLR